MLFLQGIYIYHMYKVIVRGGGGGWGASINPLYIEHT